MALGVGAAGALLVGFMAFSTSAASSSPAAQVEAEEGADAEFWAYWGDGRAELNGYRLTQPRYGQARSGSVVHVVVTEPFSYEERVKADPGRHPDRDVFQVLKLNAVRDFQTGIYDYNYMTSVFMAVSPHPKVRVGQPTKLTFSGQEWCGMVFEQLTYERRRVDQHRFSYFDGEGETRSALPHPEDALTMDALPMFLRGLVSGAPLKRGASRPASFLPSVERTRMVHRTLEWTKGVLARAAAPKKVELPAGTFEVDTYSVSLENGDRYAFFVEVAYPHRLVKWTGPEGEVAELLGSTRLPYWRLNGEGAESYLKEIGLSPAKHP